LCRLGERRDGHAHGNAGKNQGGEGSVNHGVASEAYTSMVKRERHCITGNSGTIVAER
jgi:hypothetical protein